MVVYVIVGASRGLGYEFVRQLSQAPNNMVFGLVRDKAATEKKVAQDELKNVHIVTAEITDRASLQAARAEIEKKTSFIDVLIHNAAIMPPRTYFRGLSDYEDTPDIFDADMLTTFEINTFAAVKAINTFLPLVQKSSIKKVVALSTGLADDNLSNGFDLYEGALYAMSKAALNTAIAKYNARYGKSSDNILFMAISPGLVDTGNGVDVPPDSQMPLKFAQAYPHTTGPTTPEESIKAVMSVIERAEASNEFAGSFVSHFGNKQWL